MAPSIAGASFKTALSDHRRTKEGGLRSEKNCFSYVRTLTSQYLATALDGTKDSPNQSLFRSRPADFSNSEPNRKPPRPQTTPAGASAGRSRLAEREGFEPPDRCRSTVFKTAAFDHSATSPQGPRSIAQSAVAGEMAPDSTAAREAAMGTALPAARLIFLHLLAVGDASGMIVRNLVENPRSDPILRLWKNSLISGGFDSDEHTRTGPDPRG